MEPQVFNAILLKLVKISLASFLFGFGFAALLKYILIKFFNITITYWKAYIIFMMGSLLITWGRPAVGFFFGVFGIGSPTIFFIVDIVVAIAVWWAVFSTQLKKYTFDDVSQLKSVILAFIMIMIGTVIQLLPRLFFNMVL